MENHNTFYKLFKQVIQTAQFSKAVQSRLPLKSGKDTEREFQQQLERLKIAEESTPCGCR